MKNVPIDWEMAKIGEEAEREAVDSFIQQHVDRYRKEKGKQIQNPEAKKVDVTKPVNAVG